MSDPATMTADEVAALLGVSRQTVYDSAGRGEIPCVRIGRRAVFSRVALLAWLNSTAPVAVTDSLPAPPPPRSEPPNLKRLRLAIDDERHRIDRLCRARPTGYVYAIRHGDTEYVKVGKADDPAVRIADIQKMTPVPLELVGLCHDAGMERGVHRVLRGHHWFLEWFRFNGNPIPSGERGCFACEECLG